MSTVFNYLPAITTAYNEIQRFGRRVDFMRELDESFTHWDDLDTVWDVNTETGMAVTQWDRIEGGVMVKATFRNYRQQEIDGSKIQLHDKSCFVPALNLPIIIDTSMTLLDSSDSAEYQIVVANPIRPGPELIGYRLQLRL